MPVSGMECSWSGWGLIDTEGERDTDPESLMCRLCPDCAQNIETGDQYSVTRDYLCYS